LEKIVFGSIRELNFHDDCLMCENVRVDAEEIQEHMWDEVFPLLDQHFFQVLKQIPVSFLF
jgi:hypothetical protein